MLSFKNIKNNLLQIIAIAEKNIKLGSRYKLNLILSFITPLINIILPLIVFGQIFTFREDFGPWNENNYVIYQIVTYQIILLYGFIFRFPGELKTEKMWKTLPALIIAPFNRINLLFGIFLSHIIVISIPFTAFFIFCYIIYPISIITILFVFFIFILMALFFGGLGLIFGVFAIAKENFLTIMHFGLSFAIMFSCLTLPFEFFPGYFQNLANLNPLYYIFNFVRLAWIEDNLIFTITMHSFSFFIVTSFAVITPLFGLYFFNFIYKKYGIAGY